MSLWRLRWREERRISEKKWPIRKENKRSGVRQREVPKRNNRERERES